VSKGRVVDEMLAALRPVTPELSAQELPSTLWALAKLLVDDEPLIEALSAASVLKLPQFVDRALSITAWSLAALAL